MIPTAQAEHAARFAALHRSGCFILPNAWDVPSAALIAAAGYPAIATTSSGVAFSLGLVDGERIERARMLAVAGEIARRSPIPVTVDLEAGYGREPEAVADSVRAAIAAGCVGCNIEDGDPAGPGLFDFDLSVARIRAGVEAAKAAGLPDFVLNARTDPYLRAVGDAETCFAEAVKRANAYAEVGALSLFVPGPRDAATISALTTEISGPVNMLVVPGLAPFSDVAALGVRRISLGGALAGSASGHAKTVLEKLHADGDFAGATERMSHGEMMALVGGFGPKA